MSTTVRGHLPDRDLVAPGAATLARVSRLARHNLAVVDELRIAAEMGEDVRVHLMVVRRCAADLTAVLDESA